MIKLTTKEGDNTVIIPLSKICCIVEHDYNVYVSVLGAAESVIVNESMDEVSSRIEHALNEGKIF